MEFELVCIVSISFVAGMVDAIAGGGGLLQLPALLFLFPHLAPGVLLSTNKLPSFCGSIVASYYYAKRVTIDYKLVSACVGSALICSAVGAYLVSSLPSEYFKPVVVVFLLISAWRMVTLRIVSEKEVRPAVSLRWAFIAAGIAGLYDGFFGPGTGTILISLFVARLGLSFLDASAHAKVVNLATNFGAIVYFLAHGQVQLDLVLPMIGANMLGGFAGTKLALFRGSTFVRKTVLIMVVLIVGKLCGDFVF